MAQLAKTHQEQLARVKKNIDNAHKAFTDNVDVYHKARKIVFDTALSLDEKATLKELNKPPLEFNVLEAYIDRLIGEWSKQTPAFKISAFANTPGTVETVDMLQQHLAALKDAADQNGFSDEVYKETLSGGFSVIKVRTEYASEDSFDQIIKLEKVYDPTLCGFDPMARHPAKADAKYAYEFFPIKKSEFEEKYPNVDLSSIQFTRDDNDLNWYYNENDEDVLLLCDYYEVQHKSKMLYFIYDPIDEVQKTVTKDELDALTELASLKPVADIKIIKKRKVDYKKIVRYQLIGETVLDFVETDYDHLPLIFVDGNSAVLKIDNSITQKTRPYVYHAIGMQRLKNFAGQTLAAELEGMIMHKFMVDARSVPQDAEEAWENTQKASVLFYNSTDDSGTPLPPPQAVPRNPTPPEVLQTFTGAEQTIQNILGSYDSALGINNNQLSGVAIVEGATQSNNTAMPYVVNFLTALTHAAQVIVGLIPKYYVTPRTIPLVEPDGTRSFAQINGAENQYQIKGLSNTPLNVMVQAGPSFEVQKNKAVQTLVPLIQTLPNLAQIMNGKGMPILLDNLDFRGVEDLKSIANEFIDKMEAQAQNAQPQPNPAIALQAQKNDLEQQKLQDNRAIEARKAEIQEKVLEQKEMKMAHDSELSHMKNMIELMKIENERSQSERADEMKVMQQNQENIRNSLQDLTSLLAKVDSIKTELDA